MSPTCLQQIARLIGCPVETLYADNPAYDALVELIRIWPSLAWEDHLAIARFARSRAEARAGQGAG